MTFVKARHMSGKHVTVIFYQNFPVQMMKFVAATMHHCSDDKSRDCTVTQSDLKRPLGRINNISNYNKPKIISRSMYDSSADPKSNRIPSLFQNS